MRAIPNTVRVRTIYVMYLSILCFTGKPYMQQEVRRVYRSLEEKDETFLRQRVRYWTLVGHGPTLMSEKRT